MTQSYEEKIAALRVRFLQGADERVAVMAQLTDEAMSGNGASLPDLHMLLHDMGGNAMMLSFEHIGLTARKGQETVSIVEERGQVSELAGLSGVLVELSDAIVRAREEMGVGGTGAGSDGNGGARADDS